jgi:hypothetical protein
LIITYNIYARGLVDGFEIAVPTLRREDLEISDNAIIYSTYRDLHVQFFSTSLAE